MSKVLITDVVTVINGSDSVLDSVILDYITDNDLGISVSQWKLNNYSELRRWAYPQCADLFDALVKQNSGDSELISEGDGQFLNYIQACLAVKTRFPKE